MNKLEVRALLRLKSGRRTISSIETMLGLLRVVLRGSGCSLPSSRIRAIPFRVLKEHACYIKGVLLMKT